MHLNFAKTGTGQSPATPKTHTYPRTLSPKPRLRGIAGHFFTAQERRSLQHLTGQERTERFLRIWTVKESFVKLTGQGLEEVFGRVESAALLAGNGDIAGRNFPLDDAVIGICAQHGTLPDKAVIVPQDFIRIPYTR